MSINPKKVFLTTNSHPSHWWSRGNGTYYNWEHGEYRAFARRVAVVKWWNDAKELTTLENPGRDDGTEGWAYRDWETS